MRQASQTRQHAVLFDVVPAVRVHFGNKGGGAGEVGGIGVEPILIRGLLRLERIGEDKRGFQFPVGFCLRMPHAARKGISMCFPRLEIRQKARVPRFAVTSGSGQEQGIAHNVTLIGIPPPRRIQGRIHTDEHRLCFSRRIANRQPRYQNIVIGNPFVSDNS